MRIIVHEDTTGAAPDWARFQASDDDTYDGAPDANHPIGLGATADEAKQDLLEKIGDSAVMRLAARVLELETLTRIAAEAWAPQLAVALRNAIDGKAHWRSEAQALLRRVVDCELPAPR
jgi:hypothetical protein